MALQALSGAGYSTELLLDTGVIGESENRHYDRFRDRVMFPFYDLQGHVIGFSGRIIHAREGVGKYINIAETPLFYKREAHIRALSSTESHRAAGLCIFGRRAIRRSFTTQGGN